MTQYFGTGAHPSPRDYRNLKHPKATMGYVPVLTGGIHYDTTKDIDNQRRVGICTAISLVQNAEKFTGKKYSPDFQYLLQKKYLDGNWDEGSSPFNAFKVGMKYGFLPLELFTYITEADRDLSYDQYIVKLQAIPDTEIPRLLTLCEKPLLGYAQVDVSSAENIARAILDSATGIICRYDVGHEWYSKPDGTISWKTADIDPITPYAPPDGGHAIGASFFDFTVNKIIEHPNTWGGSPTSTWPTPWDMNGICTINWDKYKMTEAWVPHYLVKPVVPVLPVHQPLTRNLYFGMMNNDDVKRMQHVLGVKPETGNFGLITLAAVKAYQKANNIPATGFVGTLTRASLNAKYF
jgi:peptidoglycan hydrolase-like protein with peptidoglycan-binding domain